MCGGFNCSKNSLALLNILFLLVSFVLIGMGSYARATSIISSFEIAGGIIASGLFLFLISFLGLFAGFKHHQVLLFFYIVVLFLLFIIQFSVSIACLAVSEKQVENAIEKVWTSDSTDGLKNNTIKDAEKYFTCCGWETNNSTECQQRKECQSPTPTVSDTVTTDRQLTCRTCSEVIPYQISHALEASGGVGLFFSFTEMLGVWLAVRFRNQKDPKANPSQFL
uniref:Tetraspanin-13 n=1 Tax=Phallusia mammillata TaxID=59560 RepID=A0A6F9DVV3_9ASCI|nr:tetraspanin-13 [Phallusia mammillata]